MPAFHRDTQIRVDYLNEKYPNLLREVIPEPACYTPTYSVKKKMENKIVFLAEIIQEMLSAMGNISIVIDPGTITFAQLSEKMKGKWGL